MLSSTLSTLRPCILGILLGLIFAAVIPSMLSRLSVLSSSVSKSLMSSASAVSPYSMVFVTAPNKDVAHKLASGIVTEKLAACVNIIPGISSVYVWEGKVENDEELLMMIKTRTDAVPALSEYVRKNHPYDVAEVISTSIEQGNQPYLDWIGKIVPAKPESNK